MLQPTAIPMDSNLSGEIGADPDLSNVSAKYSILKIYTVNVSQLTSFFDQIVSRFEN